MTVKNNRKLIFFFDESCSLYLKAIKILKVIDVYSIDYDGNILK